MRKLLLALFLFFFLVSLPGSSHADTPTPTETPIETTTGSVTPTPDNQKDTQDVVNKIHDLEGKVRDLQGQEKTLSTQIAVMDSNIKLTQYRMQATTTQLAELEKEIEIANKKIETLDTALANVTKIFLNRVVATYESAGELSSMQMIAKAENMNDFIRRASYLKLVQQRDKELLYETQQAKMDYANQKQIFETKQAKMEALQAQLEKYTNDLTVEQESKKSLLSQTQGSEATYERLLREARTQLAGFSRFVASQGGASILSGQTSCDDWGCYYNQRDSQWGAAALNNTGYTIASDGCLITSMAMVYTHYGHKNVTPLTINSNPQNFASYEPAWLNKTIIADGTTASRVSSDIDGVLSSGNPVVVGISYDNGPLPDHFVVLISGSGGNYQMNDPFLPNGHNVSFNEHYSVASIREIEKVSM